jgi:decaprenylphospho-beta-D-erythro-pentofuranosid-2-ulose 2-reductase
MKNILIIGATSAIAESVARQFAGRGDKLFLCARNEERLISLAKDLKVRGASSVDYLAFEANQFERHKDVIDEAFEKLGGIDIALIAHGTLPDQKACEEDVNLTLQELNTNGISVISLLTYLANSLENQKSGTIAVISSPAGDRGRQSNYVYGAAKAAVTTFTQGLRNRLHKSGVHVLTIKPGFIDTPMTVNFKKGLMWSTTEKIAPLIVSAIEKRKNSVYVPWFWMLIMGVIKTIPEPVFKRLSL